MTETGPGTRRPPGLNILFFQNKRASQSLESHCPRLVCKVRTSLAQSPRRRLLGSLSHPLPSSRRDTGYFCPFSTPSSLSLPPTARCSISAQLPAESDSATRQMLFHHMRSGCQLKSVLLVLCWLITFQVRWEGREGGWREE